MRLAGMDAPERAQPYGQQAKQALSGLAFGKTATVAVNKIDDYGRTLGVVTVAGVNVEAEQIRRGWWAEAHPMPPWDWRHGRNIGEAPAVRSATATDSSEVAGPCEAKRTCGEMISCEEARFYLTQCGLSRLDRDKDGTPCEALCK